jgi:hypothetical protein
MSSTDNGKSGCTGSSCSGDSSGHKSDSSYDYDSSKHTLDSFGG